MRLTAWLAPIMPFTMEEVWLERYPGDDSSVHLVDFPETPASWRNANVEEAVAKGVFGSPFYVVDDRERFWGQDRLEDLDLHLSGKL